MVCDATTWASSLTLSRNLFYFCAWETVTKDWNSTDWISHRKLQCSFIKEQDIRKNASPCLFQHYQVFLISVQNHY